MVVATCTNWLAYFACGDTDPLAFGSFGDLAQGMVMDIESDAMHLHLEVLWKSFRCGDYKDGVIHLDLHRWHCILSSKICRDDGSLGRGMVDGKEEWRCMPVVVHKGSPVSGMPSDPVAEIIDEPFCMYIEAIKHNGRREYFDNAKTDEQFL